MRRYKLTFILIFVFMFLGLCTINLNLNRQIYSTIVGDSKYKNNLSTNNPWNLDHMEDILTYPEKYNVGVENGEKESMANVPKIRVLFNGKPFDFRIDTDKYIFFININVLENLNNKFNGLIDSFRKKTVKVWNVVEG